MINPCPKCGSFLTYLYELVKKAQWVMYHFKGIKDTQYICTKCFHFFDPPGDG